MYAQVVVLTYQSPDIKTYTYEIPKILQSRIQIGQLVSVPFGKRMPTGIVTGINPDRVSGLDPKTIKTINSILIAKPLLLPYQLKLLDWLSSYYYAPMVNCLEAMLPEIPRRSLKADRTHLQGVIQISPRAHPGGEQIDQTLVLVPNINRIPETLARFARDLRRRRREARRAKYPQAKNYVSYHNELNLSQKFATWQKILSGNVDYIFGSRSAIFTPCPNLSRIVIFDEHNGAYKDERSPYYDTLTVAQKLMELTRAKLEIADSTPKITTYSNFSRLTPGVKLRLQQDRTPGVGSVPKVKVVNMLAEKAAGNKSPLSEILQTYIKLGVKKNKRILLFLNKKSESGHIYCKDCKYSDFAPTQPETCPNCGSVDIWFNSLNINSLASLIKKIVPSASVNIIADSSVHPRGEVRFSPEVHPRGVLDGLIDIATASVFYRLLVKKYDLVAHIRTDSILNISDFSQSERFFAQIADLKKITKGLLLLQTYNSQDPTIDIAASGNYQKFFNSQIADRIALSYPPFALIIKLSLKGKKESQVEQKAQELFTELNNLQLTINHSPFTILGPFKPTFSLKNPKYNIILKVPIPTYSLKERELALGKIQEILKEVPRDWQVEVEPESVND